MRRFLLLACVATLAACGGDSIGPSGSVAGTYRLQLINDQSLPVVVSGGETLTNDVLSLNSDGSYSDVGQFADGTETVDQGFFTESNGFLTFTPSDSRFAQYNGTISGSILTESFSDGTVLRYQRQ